MGHRGCRTNLNIPENSLQAFAFAVEHGAHAVELDVSLSADGVLTVMHDNTVDRTCEGHGEVGEMMFACINGLRFRKTGKRTPEHEPVEPESVKRQRWNAPTTTHAAAAAAATPHPAGRAGSVEERDAAECECGEEWLPRLPFPPSLLPGERVTGPPSLEQVVRLVQQHGLRLMIELKEWRRPELLFERLLQLYAAYPYLQQHSFVATFNPYHLYRLRSLQPSLPTCLLYCRDCLQWYHTDGSREMQLPALINTRPVRWLLDQALLQSIPLVAAFLRPACLGPQNVLLSIERCEAFRLQGVLMYVWCVNRSCELQLWSQEGAVVGTDFVFPLRDSRAEGEEARDGQLHYTLQDERRWQEELKQQSGGGEGQARRALTLDT